MERETTPQDVKAQKASMTQEVNIPGLTMPGGLQLVTKLRGPPCPHVWNRSVMEKFVWQSTTMQSV